MLEKIDVNVMSKPEFNQIFKKFQPPLPRWEKLQVIFSLIKIRSFSLINLLLIP